MQLHLQDEETARSAQGAGLASAGHRRPDAGGGCKIHCAVNRFSQNSVMAEYDNDYLQWKAWDDQAFCVFRMGIRLLAWCIKTQM